LKFKRDSVCHPCCHGKMVAASHLTVNQVMTKEPSELPHMDTVGPAQVRSDGEKWYILVIMDAFLDTLGCFSWRVRMRLFHMLGI
jgi:hypothetical protein